MTLKRKTFEFFDKYLSGLDLALDSHAGGIMVTNKDGHTNLSERMTHKEALAFVKGIAVGAVAARKQDVNEHQVVNEDAEYKIGPVL
jgi:hypothetical protein